MEGVVVDKVCRVLDDLLALSAIGRERLVAPAPVPEGHHDAAALQAALRWGPIRSLWSTTASAVRPGTR